MCGMCFVIGAVAVVGGIVAYVGGKLSGKPKTDHEESAK